MALFAAFAVVLGALGIYGVVWYSVAQRTHEIGIRMAVGASRVNVLFGILKQSSVLALLGAALGLAASYALTPLLRALLYGVSATNLSAFAASAAVANRSGGLRQPGASKTCRCPRPPWHACGMSEPIRPVQSQRLIDPPR